MTKRIGLQGLIFKIAHSSTLFIHGYNTCQNESLNSEKITDKRIDNWQHWGQKTKFELCERNLGISVQFQQLFDSLSLRLSSNMQSSLDKITTTKQKESIRRSTDDFRKKKSEQKKKKKKERQTQTELSQLNGQTYGNSQIIEDKNVHLTMQCEVCGKTYKSKYYFEQHKKLHQ